MFCCPPASMLVVLGAFPSGDRRDLLESSEISMLVPLVYGGNR